MLKGYVMTLTNHFFDLLQRKETQERRKISISEVSRATGISRVTLQAWSENRVSRYDAPVIQALCGYFGCSVGELIENV
jgi:DNA-binding Xre family transcriptional regulator